MTTLESTHQYAKMLPDSLQQEVLDFVRFLLFKQEQEITPAKMKLIGQNLVKNLSAKTITLIKD